ncbi:hypothetical protein RCO28_32315 [Streptomyces sp. LHD-70]|uniref:hypothetical protein n=1 Tax=Streptomyces sp. LHD-70 TaxID=3072140 RepID=UPI00280EA078|nr:hypothetical protein [Streptomyces sp. LHD-70]MDQ8707123.1 hypothetical protein [Streptomyces sp. LHD-70]
MRLTGLDVTDVRAIVYAPSSEGEAEAIELRVGERNSVVITSGTDWTLRGDPGVWGVLPGWCYPPESWRREDIPELGGAGELGPILEEEILRDPAGEADGVRLGFKSCEFTIMCGDPFSFEIHRKAS